LTGAEARTLLNLPAAWPLIPAVDDGQGKRPRAKWGGIDWPKWDHWTAELWGLLTGRVTGFVALDFDGEAGAAVLSRLGLWPHMQTGSGGHHVYITAPPYPVKTVAGALPGVDVRGEGGLVYVAGRSRKGPYVALRPITEPLPFDSLPAAAKKLLVARPERTSSPAATWNGTEPGTMAAVSFVLKAVRKINAAEPGTWNRTFHTMAYAIAGLVAGGQLAEGYGLDALRGIGLDAASEVALVSSWARGSEKPWSAGGARVILGVTDTPENGASL
jgi:bifunctional DNA primase/polymerase-like protein